MEQISNQFAQLNLMPEQQNYLTNLKDKFLPNESKIIELKYTGKPFGKMDESERWFAAQTILLKIHAIKGWTIPVSEMMDILVDQFQHKLNEGYQNVTVAEMEYAFRNSTDVKDWGKALNLSLIDEVMIPYLENRFDLSRQEENTVKPLQIERSKELTDEEWEEWIVDIRNYPLELIPITCYDYLVRKEKINLTVAEKKDYMEKAMPLYAISIQENQRDWSDFIRQKMENKVIGKHFDSLVTFSKRLIISDYLKNNP